MKNKKCFCSKHMYWCIVSSYFIISQTIGIRLETCGDNAEFGFRVLEFKKYIIYFIRMEIWVYLDFKVS